MMSSPEQTAKKTPVPSIPLLNNGCKQAFPLLTVDLQRARHNISMVYHHIAGLNNNIIAANKLLDIVARLEMTVTNQNLMGEAISSKFFYGNAC
jgi:hypothetical protein